MNAQDFRTICGQFATGVTVITTTHNNVPIGFTANSFTSVSLEPAIVLFCLKTTSESNAAFQESKAFAINILSDAQEDVSNAFANPKNSQEARFANAALETHDLPVLKDTLGYLSGNIVKHEEMGDHIVYYGQVTDGKHYAGNPLLYAKGGYQRLP